MARSYKIKPDQLEEVHIFVDTRGGGLRVLHDFELYRRALGVPGEDVPPFCLDAGKHPDGLPEGVYKETAHFAPVTFAVAEEIDKDSLKYDENPKDESQPLVTIDLTKRTRLRIKYLLRKWSIGETDQELELQTYTRPSDKRVMLTNETLEVINNKVHPQIIKGFMQAYEFSTRLAANQAEDEAIEAVKEGSGGKINVKN